MDTQHPTQTVIPQEFSRDDLADAADSLDQNHERSINVGNVTGVGDSLLESCTALAARFIRTMLANDAQVRSQMRTLAENEALRHTIGTALSEALTDKTAAAKPDWHDSREIDRILDKILPLFPAAGNPQQAYSQRPTQAELIAQFHNGVAAKDWNAWGADVIALLKASNIPIGVEPVARLHITETDTYPDVSVEVLDGTTLQPSMSPVLVYSIPQATQEALTVWFGPMPESNGKKNWTVMLRRKESSRLLGSIASGVCFGRSEYYDRMRYEADRLRYLIGEIPTQPWILDYDAESKGPPETQAEKAQS